MKRLFIRADGSAAIGTGHIFRSLTLARGLMAKGYRVWFLCRHLPQAPLKRIAAAGCGLILIPDVKLFEEE